MGQTGSRTHVLWVHRLGTVPLIWKGQLWWVVLESIASCIGIYVWSAARRTQPVLLTTPRLSAGNARRLPRFGPRCGCFELCGLRTAWEGRQPYLSLCIYIYIYTVYLYCIYIYIYISIYTYIYIYILAYEQPEKVRQPYLYLCVYIYICIYTVYLYCIYIYTYIYIYIY